MHNILFVSLGCDKNLCDSEAMLGLLHDNGYQIVSSEEEADVIVVNTCSFIHDAKQESIDTIIEMGQLKNTGKLKALVVCGCLAQRYKDDILKELPEVDCVVGTTALDKIVEAVNEALKGAKHSYIVSEDELPLTESKRVMSTGSVTSYLKIAEGCDKHCTYCIIPKLRGKYRSIPMERLIDEAKYLAEQGIKELIVVAQETTVYGVDLYGKKMLPQLLKQLAEIDGIEWIRVMYCYPEEITDELIDTIASNEKICKYIDIPIQHASDNVLKRMGRKATEKSLYELINKLRTAIPDIVIRTTLITGFPGETEEDFEKLLDFVYDNSFERLGVFTYSAEDGTPAAMMDNQIPENIKEERKDAIMQMQQDIAFDNTAAKVSDVYKAIIEGYMPNEDVYVARTYMDAPGIDGFVFVNSPRQLMTGQFVDVLITGSDGYDLVGDYLKSY